MVVKGGVVDLGWRRRRRMVVLSVLLALLVDITFAFTAVRGCVRRCVSYPWTMGFRDCFTPHSTQREQPATQFDEPSTYQHAL